MSFNTIRGLSLLTILLVSVSCGLKTQNPMTPYKNLQLVPESELNGVSTQKVQYIVVENNKNIITQVDEKNPPADGAGQVALQNGMYQIIVPENINFIEGKTLSFKMSLKFLIGKVKSDIEVSHLPDDQFKIEKISEDVNESQYKVTWKPAKGIIPKDKMSLTETLKISLKDIQYVSDDKKENEVTKKAIEGLVLKTTDISYVIRRDKNMPTFIVKGLDSELHAGQVTKFTVDIVAPENYDAEVPLLPEIFFDLVNIVNDKGLVLANGAYYVNIDPEFPKVEKISKSKNKWRMHYIFDAKNVKLLPQFDKNLRMVSNTDRLYVSLSMRVSSDKVAVSEKQTFHLEILLN